jgi:hypothetical protein
MTMILIFVIAYIAASAWDVSHVNALFDKMVNPAAHRRPQPVIEPAPRLVISRTTAPRSIES